MTLANDICFQAAKLLVLTNFIENTDGCLHT